MSKRDLKKKRGAGSFFIIIVAGIAVIAVILIAIGVIPVNKVDKGRSFQITEKETRPVLDPSLFTGMTRQAYAVAKKYPDAMNEVYCYCYCNEPPFNHKSLLSCFTDEHGAG